MWEIMHQFLFDESAKSSDSDQFVNRPLDMDDIYTYIYICDEPGVTYYIICPPRWSDAVLFYPINKVYCLLKFRTWIYVRFYCTFDLMDNNYADNSRSICYIGRWTMKAVKRCKEETHSESPFNTFLQWMGHVLCNDWISSMQRSVPVKMKERRRCVALLPWPFDINGFKRITTLIVELLLISVRLLFR